MKEQKYSILISLIIVIVSLSLAIIIKYYSGVKSLFQYPDFIIDCLLGIFTGAFLTLLISIINYRLYRKKEIIEFYNFVNQTILSIVPTIYPFIRNAERNPDYEIELILAIHNNLLNNLHMHIDGFSFIFPTPRLGKVITDVRNILFDVYGKTININKLVSQYKFGLIKFEQLDEQIKDLFTVLRNYDGDQALVNLLTEMHSKISVYGKLKVTHSKTIKFN